MMIKSPVEWTDEQVRHWKSLSEWTRHLIVFIVALHFVLIFAMWTAAPARAAAQDVIIQNDSGGILGPYIERGEQWRREGRRIVVDGPCMSACTFYLRTGRVCATSRAIFGIHATPFRDAGAVEADRHNIKLYPKRVQVLLGHRLPRQIRFFSGAELGVPECH